jgi:UDP-N-acetylglucosamine 2-epimerase (non-hydrolysing)
MRRAAVIVGTRPEAIKLAPLVRVMRQEGRVEPYVISTAQHGPVLRDALAAFGLRPDLDLDLHHVGQTPGSVTGDVLTRLGPVLRHARADAVVVQGDTASAFAGALAAFYAGLALVHVEAGLRSGNRREPFPEEMHRRLITSLADLHLAPTGHARDTLIGEGIDPSAVVVTGNTVLDAVALTSPAQVRPFADPRVAAAVAGPDRLILVTVHRRESWGPALHEVAEALADLAGRPGIVLVLPMHPNPALREVLTTRLGGLASVVLTDWQPYGAFLALMRRADLVLTDSGGVQEEAPTFGVPVLVLRDVTDRPEAVRAGLAQLVGTRAGVIVPAALRVLGDPDVSARAAATANPYGDGGAAVRCAEAISRLLVPSAPVDRSRLPGGREVGGHGLDQPRRQHLVVEPDPVHVAAE